MRGTFDLNGLRYVWTVHEIRTRSGAARSELRVRFNNVNAKHRLNGVPTEAEAADEALNLIQELTLRSDDVQS
jgi:hypothetical protein